MNAVCVCTREQMVNKYVDVDKVAERVRNGCRALLSSPPSSLPLLTSFLSPPPPLPPLFPPSLPPRLPLPFALLREAGKGW